MNDAEQRNPTSATGVAGLSIEDATGERSALNLLVVRDIGPSVGDIAALGVRRISVGGAPALAAWGGFMRAAQTLKSDGSFAGFDGPASYAGINDFLAAELRTRGA